ncbi:hypothetical protein D3C77_717810 [compost metagenome]
MTGVAQPRGQLDAENGVAAELEEIVLDPQGPAEQFFPECQHLALPLAGWRRAQARLLPHHGRQSARIQLAIGGQG